MTDGVSSNAVVPGTPSVPVTANSVPLVPNSYVPSDPNSYAPLISNSYESEPFEDSGNESRPIILASSSSESGSEHVSIHVQSSVTPVSPYQRGTTEGASMPYAPRNPYAPGPSAPAQGNFGLGLSFFQGDPYAAGPSRVPVYNPNVVMPAVSTADRSEYYRRQLSRMNNSLISTREKMEIQAQAWTVASDQSAEAVMLAREGKEAMERMIWIFSVAMVLVVALLVVVLFRM